MIENIMKEYCAKNGLVYEDYYVTRGGKIVFFATKPTNKVKKYGFEVWCWRPFRVTRC